MASINTSGHKYGLVYPGVGWVLWRDRSALPEELVFTTAGDVTAFDVFDVAARPAPMIMNDYGPRMTASAHDHEAAAAFPLTP